MSSFNMKIFVGIGFIFWSFQSSATLQSTVTVGVNSSGNAVYPCNVGIADNPNGEDDDVDFISASYGPSPTNANAGTGTGTVTGSSSMGYTVDPDRNTLIGLFGSSYGSYNQLFAEEDMYNYELVNSTQNGSSGQISINLASSTYNGAYFVTFCYVASKLNQIGAGVDRLLSFASAVVTHSPIGNSGTYATDAGLKSMIEIKCSKDGGYQHYTPGGEIVLSSLLTTFGEGTTVELAGGGVNIDGGSIGGSGTALINGEVPEVCRVRFHFVETSGLERPTTLVSSDIKLDITAKVVQQ